MLKTGVGMKIIIEEETVVASSFKGMSFGGELYADNGILKGMIEYVELGEIDQNFKTTLGLSK